MINDNIFFSGFLVSYLVMKEFKRSRGKLNLIGFYLHRYIRMTPLMMGIIAFSAMILPYVAEGPSWLESITMFSAWCKNNWWLNALYLHNFIDTNNMVIFEFIEETKAH